MKYLYQKIKNGLLRTFWTQKRVNKWFDYVIPKGAVLANDIVEKATALGIPDDRFVKAKETFDPIIFDGDGGNLVMWMRRDTPDFYNLPVRHRSGDVSTYKAINMKNYRLGADIGISDKSGSFAIKMNDYKGFSDSETKILQQTGPSQKP